MRGAPQYAIKARFIEAQRGMATRRACSSRPLRSRVLHDHVRQWSVYSCPAFVGWAAALGQHARGTLAGYARPTAGHSPATHSRARVQTVDVVDAMQSDAGITISELRVEAAHTH